jgi:hypothetical protein
VPASGGQRAKPEDRSLSQPLGGRPIAQDQLRDGASRLGAGRRLGDRGPRSFTDRYHAAWIRLEISGPVGVRVAGRHEQGPVGFLDEADRDRNLATGDATGRQDSRDRAPADELIADLVRAQRPRCCQDLPSVTTDGA